MKLLRKIIQKMILQEGMVTADQLPDDVIIRIREFGGRSARIQYAWFDDRQQKLFPTGIFSRPDPVKEEHPQCWGTIVIEKDVNGKPVWQVASSQSGEGYGPLLYDIAMEYATERGLGLMSDRSSVSDGEDGAVNVWDYYMEHRVGNDVEAHQMDDQANTLTDTFDDNVNQHVAKQFAPGGKWSEHSTSKRYTKAPTTIKALGDKVIYS